MQIAGVIIKSNKDLADKITYQLRGSAIWADKNDFSPIDGLMRAVRASGTKQVIFAATIAKALLDTDIKVRTCAVALLPEVVDVIDPAYLAMALHNYTTMLIDVEPQGVPLPYDLATGVAMALAKVASIPKHLEMVRQFAKKSSWVLPALAKNDPDWLVANAAEVVPRKSIGGLLCILSKEEQRQALLIALSPWPVDECHEVLKAPWWETLPILDSERKALRAILSNNIH